MSQRRMFSPKIVGSDEFLDMPTSSRELYFQFGMYADDDGFISPRKVMRMVGASEDDLKVLITKKFAIPFERGIIVITHWKSNNLVRKDWYQETIYKEEKSLLKEDDNGNYLLDNKLVNESLTEIRIGQDRIGKKDIATSVAIESPFSLKEEILKLENNPRRDMNIIALFLEKKKPDISTKEQYQQLLKRHLRSAKSLSPFEDEKILRACKIAEEGYPKIWTIETLVKILTK